MTITHCKVCLNNDTSNLYEVGPLPVFQNRLFNTAAESTKAATGKVLLFHCNTCGFIFNSEFDESIMKYDQTYQNEQANSSTFKEHLNEVIKILLKENIPTNNVVEIGCGKGYFLDILKENSIKATGFDPTYEGNEVNIIKDYYSGKYKDLDTEFIILRHVLEHIEEPLKFLNGIKKSVPLKCKIYIEVPSFEWIQENNAFWDIFHEHCNYFTKNCLKSFFKQSKDGLLFNGQYQYILTSFEHLLDKPDRLYRIKKKITKIQQPPYDLERVASKRKNLFVWGAAAKGSTFLNILDPNSKFFKCAIDINPKKQNLFIGGTGHRVLSPNEMLRKYDSGIIVVMNDNYLQEILDCTPNQFEILSIEQFLKKLV